MAALPMAFPLKAAAALQPSLKPSTHLFVANSLDDWKARQALDHNGLLVKRQPCVQWRALRDTVDQALERFGRNGGVKTEVANGIEQELCERLDLSVRELLQRAALPAAISEQIYAD
eukprot:7092975-Prymnesium_polylepis.1